MMKYLILFFIPTAFASEKFIAVSYYDGLGDKFRVEKVVTYENCEEKVSAKKLFLDKTNELREIAYWDADGKFEEGGATNKPLLRAKVEEAFANASKSESPCTKPSSSNGAKASEQ